MWHNNGTVNQPINIKRQVKPNAYCKICRKEFYSAPYRQRMGRGKFCSSACYGDDKRTKDGHLDKKGYRVWSYTHHPLASLNKWHHVYEHWLVMYDDDPKFTLWAKENKWTIHHTNGIHNDNRKENLEWRAPGRHPQGWTMDAMIEALERAGYDVTKTK